MEKHVDYFDEIDKEKGSPKHKSPQRSNSISPREGYIRERAASSFSLHAGKKRNLSERAKSGAALGVGGAEIEEIANSNSNPITSKPEKPELGVEPASVRLLREMKERRGGNTVIPLGPDNMKKPPPKSLKSKIFHATSSIPNPKKKAGGAILVGVTGVGNDGLRSQEKGVKSTDTSAKTSAKTTTATNFSSLNSNFNSSIPSHNEFLSQLKSSGSTGISTIPGPIEEVEEEDEILSHNEPVETPSQQLASTSILMNEDGSVFQHEDEEVQHLRNQVSQHSDRVREETMTKGANIEANSPDENHDYHLQNTSYKVNKSSIRTTQQGGGRNTQQIPRASAAEAACINKELMMDIWDGGNSMNMMMAVDNAIRKENMNQSNQNAFGLDDRPSIEYSADGEFPSGGFQDVNFQQSESGEVDINAKGSYHLSNEIPLNVDGTASKKSETALPKSSKKTSSKTSTKKKSESTTPVVVPVLEIPEDFINTGQSAAADKARESASKKQSQSQTPQGTTNTTEKRNFSIVKGDASQHGMSEPDHIIQYKELENGAGAVVLMQNEPAKPNKVNLTINKNNHPEDHTMEIDEYVDDIEIIERSKEEKEQYKRRKEANQASIEVKTAQQEIDDFKRELEEELLVTPRTKERMMIQFQSSKMINSKSINTKDATKAAVAAGPGRSRSRSQSGSPTVSQAAAASEQRRRSRSPAREDSTKRGSKTMFNYRPSAAQAASSTMRKSSSSTKDKGKGNASQASPTSSKGAGRSEGTPGTPNNESDSPQAKSTSTRAPKAEDHFVGQCKVSSKNSHDGMLTTSQGVLLGTSLHKYEEHLRGEVEAHQSGCHEVERLVNAHKHPSGSHLEGRGLARWSTRRGLNAGSTSKKNEGRTSIDTVHTMAAEAAAGNINHVNHPFEDATEKDYTGKEKDVIARSNKIMSAEEVYRNSAAATESHQISQSQQVQNDKRVVVPDRTSDFSVDFQKHDNANAAVDFQFEKTQGSSMGMKTSQTTTSAKANKTKTQRASMAMMISHTGDSTDEEGERVSGELEVQPEPHQLSEDVSNAHDALEEDDMKHSTTGVESTKLSTTREIQEEAILAQKQEQQKPKTSSSTAKTSKSMQSLNVNLSAAQKENKSPVPSHISGGDSKPASKTTSNKAAIDRSNSAINKHLERMASRSKESESKRPLSPYSLAKESKSNSVSLSKSSKSPEFHSPISHTSPLSPNRGGRSPLSPNRGGRSPLSPNRGGRNNQSNSISKSSSVSRSVSAKAKPKPRPKSKTSQHKIAEYPLPVQVEEQVDEKVEEKPEDPNGTTTAENGTTTAETPKAESPKATDAEDSNNIIIVHDHKPNKPKPKLTQKKGSLRTEEMRNTNQKLALTEEQKSQIGIIPKSQCSVHGRIEHIMRDHDTSVSNTNSPKTPERRSQADPATENDNNAVKKFSGNAMLFVGPTDSSASGSRPSRPSNNARQDSWFMDDEVTDDIKSGMNIVSVEKETSKSTNVKTSKPKSKSKSPPLHSRSKELTKKQQATSKSVVRSNSNRNNSKSISKSKSPSTSQPTSARASPPGSILNRSGTRTNIGKSKIDTGLGSLNVKRKKSASITPEKEDQLPAAESELRIRLNVEQGNFVKRVSTDQRIPEHNGVPEVEDKTVLHPINPEKFGGSPKRPELNHKGTRVSLKQGEHEIRDFETNGTTKYVVDDDGRRSRKISGRSQSRSNSKSPQDSISRSPQSNSRSRSTSPVPPSQQQASAVTRISGQYKYQAGVVIDNSNKPGKAGLVTMIPAISNDSVIPVSNHSPKSNRSNSPPQDQSGPYIPDIYPGSSSSNLKVYPESSKLESNTSNVNYQLDSAVTNDSFNQNIHLPIDSSVSEEINSSNKESKESKSQSQSSRSKSHKEKRNQVQQKQQQVQQKKLKSYDYNAQVRSSNAQQKDNNPKSKPSNNPKGKTVKGKSVPKSLLTPTSSYDNQSQNMNSNISSNINSNMQSNISSLHSENLSSGVKKHLDKSKSYQFIQETYDKSSSYGTTR